MQNNLMKIALEADARREDAAIAEGRAAPREPAPTVVEDEPIGGTGRGRPEVTGEVEAAEPASEMALVEDALEGDIEADVVRDDAEISENLDEQEEVKAAMESLFIIQDNIAATIKAKTCSAQSIGFMRHQANVELGRVHMRLSGQAMESAGMSLEEQHTIVLESIGGALDRIAQKYVLNFKHQWNAMTDVFRSVKGRIGRYEQSLNEAEAALDKKKSSLKQHTHKGSLVELWYFFATDKGQAKDIMNAIPKDLEMSTYVLTKYVPDVLAEMTKFSNALKSGTYKTVDDFKRVLNNLEKLKNPGELFETKYIGRGKPYFNVTGLVFNTGNKRTPLSLGGQTFQRLSDLALPFYVQESGSVGHSAKKVATQVGQAVPGAIGLGVAIGTTAAAAEIAFSTEDISKAIEYGKKYLNNVTTCTDLSSKLESYEEVFGTALNKFFSEGELSPEDDKARSRISFQISQIADNFTRAIGTPANAEMARSLRAGKYCAYLAKRMVYTAK